MADIKNVESEALLRDEGKNFRCHVSGKTEDAMRLMLQNTYESEGYPCEMEEPSKKKKKKKKKRNFKESSKPQKYPLSS